MSSTRKVSDLTSGGGQRGTVLWDGEGGTICSYSGPLRDALTDLASTDLEHPDADVVVFVAFGPAAAAMQRRAEAALDADEATISTLIDAMIPGRTVPPPVIVDQARRNAAFRHEVLQEFGAFTSSQVAESIGSKARNAAATAGRLVSESRLFAVQHGPDRLYLGFQFGEDGLPYPVMRRVLPLLRRAGWEIASWFVTPNSWLGDARPVDLLRSDPDAVAAAAAHDAEVPW